MEDVIRRLDALVARLSAAGWLTQGRVKAALYDVPRHVFVPPVAWTGEGDRVDRNTSPERWLDLAYGDDAIITQVDDGQTDVAAGDGRFTSSCSAPSTVVSLLELLDIEAGHRVLDVGTGTGWTAALLSRMVGAENVTSVEIDPQVSARAAENLKTAGLSPRLVVGDGAEEREGFFDRVHATCGVSHVPYAWVRQTRPGGVIVTPYAPGFASAHELRQGTGICGRKPSRPTSGG
ncbi:methyltransferase domain-containing protein [Actinomadura formosensis]